VFLPLTNLCPDRCDYCSFRRSPGDEGAWTMTPAEVIAWLDRARAQGCTEALFCLGDKPERAWRSYRETLASFGHGSTVDYLVWSCKEALARDLLPHTNAGVLDRDDIARLKPVNASLGLMLESASERLCAPGMPHHRAPDKRPARRIAMLEETGRQRVAMTTGILIGIGETVRERVEALLEIRRVHRAHGHIQEVIVQSFRAQPGMPMRLALEPGDTELAQTIAAARLILDDEVAVQAPPNLNAKGIDLLLRAGVSDFGGLSPVTPDYINPGHPWPHVEVLREACERAGFSLMPRPPIYGACALDPGFLAGEASRVVQERRA
jgi:FO synthase